MSANPLLRHLPAFMDTQAVVYCPSCNVGGPECDCAPAPAEACTEIGAEPADRLPRRLNLRFWLTVNAAGFAFYALLVWGTKP